MSFRVLVSVVVAVAACRFPSSHALSTVASSSSSSSSPQPPTISIDDVSYSHDGGEVWQLKDVSYVLPKGAKVGLTGRNGCGKSTFLKILAQSCGCRDSVGVGGGPDIEYYKHTGRITSPRNVRVAFVEQEPDTIVPGSSKDATVGDSLLGVIDNNSNDDDDNNDITSTTPTPRSQFQTVRRYQMAAREANERPDEFASATAAMDECDGWKVLTRADEVATRLRIRHLKEKPLSVLSGGERKRVALAAALVQDPDVLLLDEPTNHLDLAAIRWLSDLITSSRYQRKDLTILVVTHDRAFMDEVCNSILELDQGSLYQYPGNYAAYLQRKEERLALQDAALSSARAKLRIESNWMQRQPQARESKSKARIDAFYKLQKATKPRPNDPNLRIEKDGQRRLGGKIMTLSNVSLRFGDRNVILDDFSYEFCRGDKIGICGRNGVGKSSFIRVISGEQPVDSGEIDRGETVEMGVYNQMGLEFNADDETTVLDFVLERVRSQAGAEMAVAPNEARKLLTQFEFPRQRWQTRVSMLSGGEKRRLQLLSVLTKKPNFLVLDEPSNDIDLNTLTALETFLADYDGVLLVVSHDRFFTDKVTNHLFIFEGNGEVLDYGGTLSEYAECLLEQESRGADEGTDDGVTIDSMTKKAAYKQSKEERNERRNAIRNMKKEMKNIENALEKLKPQVINLQSEIDSSGDKGWTVLAELTEKLDDVNLQIDEKEMRWLELAEELETIEAQELV